MAVERGLVSLALAGGILFSAAGCTSAITGEGCRAAQPQVSSPTSAPGDVVTIRARPVACRPSFTNDRELQLVAVSGTTRVTLGTVRSSLDGAFTKPVVIPPQASGALQIYVLGYDDPCPTGADCAPHLTQVHVLG